MICFKLPLITQWYAHYVAQPVVLNVHLDFLHLLNNTSRVFAYRKGKDSGKYD